MPSPAQILRGILTAAIVAKRDIAGFETHNDFEVRPTYYPSIQLSDLPTSGILWLVLMGNDDKIIGRDGTFEREQPVQFAFQVKIEGNPGDRTEFIDSYEDLVDEFKDTIIQAVAGDDRFTVLRMETLRDENGMILNYMGLREANTFEAFFSVFFKLVLTP